VIGIDLPHHISVRRKELIEIPEQEVGEDVHPAVLELHEADSLVPQVSLQALQDKVLGPFHIKLQEIDVTNSLAGKKVIPAHYRALDLLARPLVGIISKGRMGTRRRMISKG
jgi:hypothetical protein